MSHLFCSLMVSEFCNRGGVEFAMGFHTPMCYHQRCVCGYLQDKKESILGATTENQGTWGAGNFRGEAVMDTLHPTIPGLCFCSCCTGQWNTSQLKKLFFSRFLSQKGEHENSLPKNSGMWSCTTSAQRGHHKKLLHVYLGNLGALPRKFTHSFVPLTRQVAPVHLLQQSLAAML